MGPKKNKITASTPATTQAVAVPSSLFGETSDASGPSTINETSLVISTTELVVPNLKEPTAAKISTLHLICNAIEDVGVPRKGASYIAIRKWIINNKENANIPRLKYNMKKAFIKALETGLLKRPAKSKDTTGLRGFFIINKEVDKKNTADKTSAKTLAVKTKISKPKTASAPTSKPASKVAVVKSKSNPEAKTSSKQKAKDMKSKSNAKVETSAKPNTKGMKSKFKTRTSIIPKNKAVKSKSKAGTSAKANTKAEESESDAKAGNSENPKTQDVVRESDEEPGTIARPKSKAEGSDAGAGNSANSKTRSVESESDEKAPNAKKKTKAVKSKADAEIGTRDNPKANVAAKTKLDKQERPKTKAAAGKSTPDSEVSPVHKQKVVAKVNGVKVQAKMGLKQASEKVPKAAKNVKEDVVLPRARRLYASRFDPVTNMSRKDLSDTELNVRPDNRKSLKSYSSDTEVEATKRGKSTKATKNAPKKNKKVPSETVPFETGPSKLNKKQKAI